MKKKNLALLLAAPFILSSYATTAIAHSEDQCGVETPKNIYSTSQLDHKINTKANLKAALGSKYDMAVPELSAQQIKVGSSIFTQTCVVCHGASGKGDGASSSFFPIRPADFTDAKESAFYSDQGRIEIIKKGIPGTQMPGWGSALSDEEVLAVYGYIRSLRVK